MSLIWSTIGSFVIRTKTSRVIASYAGYSFNASALATSLKISSMSAGASATQMASIGSRRARSLYDTSRLAPFETHISRMRLRYTSSPSSPSAYFRRKRENLRRISVFVRSRVIHSRSGQS